MGRRAFAMGHPDAYAGQYEYQVPIFVLTQTPPAQAPRQDEHLTFTFVSDGIASASKCSRRTQRVLTLETCPATSPRLSTLSAHAGSVR
jgi:hypothetical protein